MPSKIQITIRRCRTMKTTKNGRWVWVCQRSNCGKEYLSPESRFVDEAVCSGVDDNQSISSLRIEGVQADYL